MTELTPSEITGRRVKALRQAKGWPVRRLVEECRAVGFEVTSNVIENIEGIQRERAKGTQRRRGITVDEVMALALVLDVSPLGLLLPEEPSAYPVTSNIQAPAVAVYLWIIGRLEQPHVAPNVTPFEEQVLARAALRKALPWTVSGRDLAADSVQRYIAELPGAENVRVGFHDEGEIDFELRDPRIREGRSDGATEDL